MRKASQTVTPGENKAPLLNFRQLEFNFDKELRRKRRPVPYDRLYKILLEGPLTRKDIMTITGLGETAVSQIIDTLSLRYPVWSPRRGVYELLK
jgi:hypothetical protein